ncbi:MAG: UDP-N-acetylmuramate--L-alanine ligase [Candidatus Omnitrophota bacterium]
MSRKYHLVGIGGIGMSGIARILLERGFKVSGSDLKETEPIRRLRELGANVYIGHDAGNLKDADILVYSSAVKKDNPELMAAEHKSVRIIKRAQILAELMQDKLAITVAGSHGKTTTSSLVSHMLIKAGLKPTIAIGGILKNIDSNAYFGGGDYFVAEADESDGSFIFYNPQYSIITNIDREHLDYYLDFESELKAFKEYMLKTKEEGSLFACIDDQNIMDLIRDFKIKKILFGFSSKAEFYPRNILYKDLSSEFDCFRSSNFLGHFHLPLGGRHNIVNSLAVIALGLEMGIRLDLIRDAFSTYKGAGRRLEVKYKDADYIIIDDYAHHPTEIRATLEAVRNLKAKRMVAVFQPHRYTRTKLLLDEFAGCFDSADHLIITDIYPAGEPMIEGVDAMLLVDKIKRNAPAKPVSYVPKDDISRTVMKEIAPGDALIMLGAGDITRVCDELVEKIKR